MGLDQAVTVHFIGAGPGAADLITLRGQALIQRCPVCLYAGSLVPRAIVAEAMRSPQAILIENASLDARFSFSSILRRRCCCLSQSRFAAP